MNLKGSTWTLDPHVTHLNHGSFGACPLEVLKVQHDFQRRMERDPMSFFMRDLWPLLADARESLASLLRCDAAELVFVPNATSAVNAILRSFPLKPGDEILMTNHRYNACRNVIDYVARERQASVITTHVSVPVKSPGDVVAALIQRVTPATRVALVEHITSPTAMLLPVAQIVHELESRGVRCLVDGAHAPGMVDLNLDRLGASFYTGNCHKWLCTPKGCAFLHARRAHHAWIVPTVISHGWNLQPAGSSRFHALFDWPGTVDPTPWLSLPAALQFFEHLSPGGIASVARRNHQLLLAAANLLRDELDMQLMCPVEMLGSMAALSLPTAFPQPPGSPSATAPVPTHPLQQWLWDRHQIQVPVIAWEQNQLLVRISAQHYNSIADYQKLSRALRTIGAS